MKTTIMVLGLAGVMAGGLACFGMFSDKSSDPAAIEASCEGLEGQAKVDCEQRKAK